MQRALINIVFAGFTKRLINAYTFKSTSSGHWA